tara:strand:- start:420 stop:662 length:243 start_codon:yes stop_codon:yes gene_type:complete
MNDYKVIIKNREELKKECLKLKTPLRDVLKKANRRLNLLTDTPYFIIPLFIDVNSSITLHLNTVNNSFKEFTYNFIKINK